MEHIKLDLNKTQLSKLQRGMGVQLQPEIVGEGMPMKLTKEKVMKMLKAKAKGKASRLKMTETEMEGSGVMKKPKRKRVPKVIEMMEPSETMVRTQRYSTKMVDSALPASRPLISLSTANYGDLYLKG